jgi:polysaccharide deacetylase family protein (PEP-CTERM system associated)
VSEPLITPLRTRGRAPRVLTIDAEDWFHVCGDGYYSDPRRWDGFASRIETTLTLLLDRLARGGHRATLFFLGWIARRHPTLVKAARERGHEIAVHGDLHVRADEMTPAEFREDLRQASRSIAEAGADGLSVYRAAEWSIRDPRAAALSELASAGFRCDASMMPVPPLGSDVVPEGPHRIARDGWSLVELPPLTGRAFGRRLPMGGAWPFRVLSSARLAEAEARSRDRGAPAIFTLHPWELDPDHPMMDGLPAMLRAVHFAGLRGFPRRLEGWLDQDRSVAIGDVLPELVPA